MSVKYFLNLIKRFLMYLVIFMSLSNNSYADIRTTEVSSILNDIVRPQFTNEAKKPQFSDRNNVGESVDPLTGNLTINTVDLSLPGRDGLDLNISRIFNLSQSQFGTKQVKMHETATQTTERENVWVVSIYRYDDLAGGYSICFSECYEDLETAKDKWKEKIDSELYADGSYLFFYPYYTEMLVTKIKDSYYVENSLDMKKDYLITRNNLGMGWSFAFPSVEIECSTAAQNLFFHDGQGGCYRVVYTTGSNDSNLEYYPNKDVQFLRDSGSFTSLQNLSSEYKFIDQEMRINYFDGDGKLIGIVDRFGNKIDFLYEKRTVLGEQYPNISKIIDSVGRSIEFTYSHLNNSYDKLTLTVYNPDKTKNQSISYTKCMTNLGDNISIPTLVSYTDVLNRNTEYKSTEWPVETFDFKYKNLQNAGRVGKYVIQEIEYPNSVTKYEYTEVARNLGNDGLIKTYRVKSRYDCEKSWKTGEGLKLIGDYNRMDYSYENDYTGYPSYNSDEQMKAGSDSYYISSTAVNNDGISTKTVYDKNKRKVRVETVNRNNEKKIIKNLEFDKVFTYNPTKIEYTEYLAGASSPIITKYAYKSYENSWGTVAYETKFKRENDETNTTISYETTKAYGPLLRTKKSWVQDNAGHIPCEERYEYSQDTKRRLTATTNTLGQRTEYNYIINNPTDKTIEETKALESENGVPRYYKTKSYFGTKGFGVSPTKVISQYTDSNGVLKETSKTMSYDSLLGILESETDDALKTTSYTYDNAGRVLSIKKPDFTDANGVKYSVEQVFSYAEGSFSNIYINEGYSINCIIVESNTNYKNKSTDVVESFGLSRQVYDCFGNLREEWLNETNLGWVRTKKIDYDKSMRQIAVQDAEGNATSCVYDNWGRTSKLNDVEGNSYITEYGIFVPVSLPWPYSSYYSKNQYVETSYFVEKGSAEKRHYTQSIMDDFGNVIEVRSEGYHNDNVNTTSYIIAETFKYDAVGNLLEYVDANATINDGATYENGFTKQYTYDKANRVIKIKDALNQVEDIEYNILGNVKKITLSDSAKSVVVYDKKYNELGQQTSKTDYKGQISRSNYNSIGLNTQNIDRNETNFNFTYDENNRVKLNGICSKDNSENIEYKFNYLNPFGPNYVGEYKNGVCNCSKSLIYDSQGRIKTKRSLSALDNLDSSMLFDYDKNGRVKNQGFKNKDDASIFYTRYHYNKDKLEKVQTNGSYDVGTLDAQCATYKYCPDGRILSITYPTLKDGKLLQTNYNYDDINRVVTITNKKGETVLSRYVYTHSRNGNIEKVENQDGVCTNYTYDKLNRLKRISKNGEADVVYEYDLQGNRTTLSDNSATINDKGNMSYTYDLENRLESITKDGVTTTNKYNADGLRSSKTSSGKSTFYHYNNAGKVIAEADANGNITANYVWAPDRLLVKKDVGTGKDYYYLYNGHGDVVQIVDAAGNVVNQYEYDAWGNIRGQIEGVGNRFKYAGEIYDEETGLYYLRARYYDPQVGRFVSEDSFEGTVANPLSLNLYSYCHNNPIVYADPSGHWGKSVHVEATKWIFSEMGLSAYHANIVAEANIGVDSGDTGATNTNATAQGWHFDRNPDLNIDSRQVHAEDSLNGAIYNWTWSDDEYKNGRMTFEQRHQWRVTALIGIGQGLHALQDIYAHMDIGKDDFTNPISKPHTFIGENWIQYNNIDDPQYDALSVPWSVGEYFKVDTGSPFGSKRYSDTVTRSKDYLKSFYDAIK